MNSRRKMEFQQSQPIYLQIADTLCEQILRRELTEGDRIPSVRDQAVRLEVNPNTVQRTYAWLQQTGVIENKRGIGYFVAPGALKLILDIRKADFINHTCPRIFHTLKLLNMNWQDLNKIYEKWKSSQ